MLGLLLLLLGCLLWGENQTSAVQTDLQDDIHASDLRAELRNIQQELKAAMDRLLLSESLVKALQVQQNATQQELRSAMERLTDSDRLIKASVETIEASVETIEASVETIGARSNATQHEVHVLQKTIEASVETIEASVETIAARSNATKHEVHVLQKTIEASVETIEASVETIEASVETIEASVETIAARSNATQHEVHVLQKHNEDRRVAFSASLLAYGSGHTGPYNVETNLTYTHVITNVGNGYNNNTGFFTAAVRGVYQFSFFLHGYGGIYPIAARLFKNGQAVVSAWADQRRGSVNPSNGASLLLEAGDVVCVKLPPNKRIYDDVGNYDTFSGHLLFTM